MKIRVMWSVVIMLYSDPGESSSHDTVGIMLVGPLNTGTAVTVRSCAPVYSSVGASSCL
jgi:hypothetical protein